MLNVNEIRDGIIEQKTKTELLLHEAEDKMNLAWEEYEKKKQVYDRLRRHVQSFDYALSNLKGVSEEA
jgi:predicted DNA-binding protein YlxM (UPF0122 family)